MDTWGRVKTGAEDEGGGLNPFRPNNSLSWGQKVPWNQSALAESLELGKDDMRLQSGVAHSLTVGHLRKGWDLRQGDSAAKPCLKGLAVKGCLPSMVELRWELKLSIHANFIVGCGSCSGSGHCPSNGQFIHFSIHLSAHLTTDFTDSFWMTTRFQPPLHSTGRAYSSLCHQGFLQNWGNKGPKQ